jgi:hypothetical protein
MSWVAAATSPRQSSIARRAVRRIIVFDPRQSACRERFSDGLLAPSDGSDNEERLAAFRNSLGQKSVG